MTSFQAPGTDSVQGPESAGESESESESAAGGGAVQWRCPACAWPGLAAALVTQLGMHAGGPGFAAHVRVGREWKGMPVHAGDWQPQAEGASAGLGYH